MKRTTLNASTLLVLAAFSMSFNAHSQEGNDFSDVDEMIKRLEASSQVKNIAPTKRVKKQAEASVKNYVEANPDVVDVSKLRKPDSFRESEVVRPTAVITATEKPYIPEKKTPPEPSNIKHKLSELPPYTQFEFSRNVFVPAYKQGVVFFEGKELGLDSSSDAMKVLFEHRNSKDGACALLSDKSYVMMRGASDVKGNPTYLEVNKVRFREVVNATSNDSSVFAEVDFMPKGAKNSGSGNEVSLSLMCVMSKEEALKPEDYTLDNLNKSMDNLFNFQLPQFIEI